MLWEFSGLSGALGCTGIGGGGRRGRVCPYFLREEIRRLVSRGLQCASKT